MSQSDLDEEMPVAPLPVVDKVPPKRGVPDAASPNSRPKRQKLSKASKAKPAEEITSDEELQLRKPKTKRGQDKMTKPAATAVMKDVAELVFQLERSKLTQARLAAKTAETEAQTVKDSIQLELARAASIEVQRMANSERHAAEMEKEAAKRVNLELELELLNRCKDTRNLSPKRRIENISPLRSSPVSQPKMGSTTVTSSLARKPISSNDSASGSHAVFGYRPPSLSSRTPGTFRPAKPAITTSATVITAPPTSTTFAHNTTTTPAMSVAALSSRTPGTFRPAKPAITTSATVITARPASTTFAHNTTTTSAMSVASAARPFTPVVPATTVLSQECQEDRSFAEMVQLVLEVLEGRQKRVRVWQWAGIWKQRGGCDTFCAAGHCIDDSISNDRAPLSQKAKAKLWALANGE
ncbi:hypothetical protein B0H13DRAFT_1859884 [Mycena leptocephala]|nr:hypothetical protein B0H13DRAFT_1859884 [Mycena leptocephala]